MCDKRVGGVTAIATGDVGLDAMINGETEFGLEIVGTKK